MNAPLPTPPASLGQVAREVLESLAGHAEAVEVVIGGGGALAHYLEMTALVERGAPRDLRDIHRLWYRDVFCRHPTPDDEPR